MANGYFERGEMYWVRMDSGIGSEEGSFRPGVIVSSNEFNVKSPTVVIVFASTKEKRDMANRVETYATGRRSYVLCDQPTVIDKRRFGDYIGSLSDKEQLGVDRGLSYVLDMNMVDTAKEQEVAALRVETEALRAEITRLKDNESSRDIEIAMWQRLYEKALNTVVDMKFGSDMAARQPIKEKSEVLPEQLVDVNSCAFADLKNCGMTDNKILILINGRPYRSLEEVQKTLDLTTVGWAMLSKKLTVIVPAESEEQEDRLDINNCTATALKKIGFSLAMARKIVAARPFKSVEDLKRVNGLKSTQYKIMEPKLCCSPVVVVNPPKVNFAKDDPDPGCEKVNVNAVTARQLHELTGIALSTCYCIKRYQKDNGPYKTLDEIKNAKQVTPGTIDKRRHLLEV